jgi:hypothetical protein
MTMVVSRLLSGGVINDSLAWGETRSGWDPASHRVDGHGEDRRSVVSPPHLRERVLWASQSKRLAYFWYRGESFCEWDYEHHMARGLRIFCTEEESCKDVSYG